MNHEKDAVFARKLLQKFLALRSRDRDLPSMVAEDFSYMLSKRGAYIWLGVGKNHQNLHSPLYDFNDDILPIEQVSGYAWLKQNYRTWRIGSCQNCLASFLITVGSAPSSMKN